MSKINLIKCELRKKIGNFEPKDAYILIPYKNDEELCIDGFSPFDTGKFCEECGEIEANKILQDYKDADEIKLEYNDSDDIVLACCEKCGALLNTFSPKDILNYHKDEILEEMVILLREYFSGNINNSEAYVLLEYIENNDGYFDLAMKRIEDTVVEKGLFDE
ncbi:hypothetical protein [Sulfurimonas sp.]|uniref:hypothetical protein n=1 Tax=Sulfurimonas sp. TaxID=2022749 RepID=UPI003D0E49A9